MNCFNDEQIQQYIDGELSEEEFKLFDTHLNICSVCKEKVIEQKENKDFILKQFGAISFSHSDSKQDIPELITPTKTISIKRLIYLVSAAALFFLAYFFTKPNIEIQNTPIQTNNNFEFDANSSITNQDFEVSITDENGETISYYIK